MKSDSTGLRQTDLRLGGNEIAPADRASHLSMTAEEFRGLGLLTLDAAARHLDAQTSDDVRPAYPADLSTRIASMPLSGDGTPNAEVIRILTESILPHPVGNGHPRFFGWITSAPAPIGILADILATTMNANCGPGDHAVADLETAVCRWLMDLTGFPQKGSHGLLVSGGSMANLTALAVARHWACARLGRDIRDLGAGAAADLVVYQSSETHNCIAKAVELLGLGRRNLRTIPVDDDLSLRVDLLSDAIAVDRADGRTPFCVVATAGTVNSGAIDPLGPIADLCEREALWFHVDGAYGGIAAADPELRDDLEPLSRAQSLVLDPHKWLCVPIECGCVLIGDAVLQHDTFSLQADYLRGTGGGTAHESAWPFELGLQLSRAPRAVKAAAVLMRLGRQGVAETISRHRALAAWLADRIDAAPDLELTARGPLSIVCFRVILHGHGHDDAAPDRLNTTISARLNARGRVFLTPTVIRGRTSLRASIIHYDVRQHDLQILLDEVRAATADVLAENLIPQTQDKETLK
jgi:glutamate/tyrosine decarboxylase-like PLP-dependent enzyme